MPEEIVHLGSHRVRGRIVPTASSTHLVVLFANSVDRFRIILRDPQMRSPGVVAGATVESDRGAR
jgi:hypothetical protein